MTTSDEERACRARGRLALSLAADRVSARSKVTLVVGAEYGESATFLHAVRRGWRRWLVQVSGNLVVRRVEDDASLAASDVFAKSSRVQIWRERALALTASAVRVRLTGDHLRVWLVRVQQRRTTSIFLTTLPVRGSAFKDAIRALLTATWMDQRLRKEVGIADYEVRGARGTAHHVAMAEAALAFMDECGLGED